MVDWTKPIEAYHTDGSVTPVTLENDDESIMPMRVRPLLRDEFGTAEWFYRDGSRETGGWRIRNCAEPANNELAELRAFKEAAIKRFPELAPVDPDFAEAKNLMQGSKWSSGTECKTPYDPDFEGSVCDVVLKAIKCGRELERYAQGLTTPKD